jgi:hypothetical protein
MYCQFWVKFSIRDQNITLLTDCEFCENRRWKGVHTFVQYLRVPWNWWYLESIKNALLKHVNYVTEYTYTSNTVTNTNTI